MLGRYNHIWTGCFNRYYPKCPKPILLCMWLVRITKPLWDHFLVHYEDLIEGWGIFSASTEIQYIQKLPLVEKVQSNRLRGRNLALVPNIVVFNLFNMLLNKLKLEC